MAGLGRRERWNGELCLLLRKAASVQTSSFKFMAYSTVLHQKSVGCEEFNLSHRWLEILVRNTNYLIHMWTKSVNVE